MISINQPALKRRLNAAGLNLSGQKKQAFILFITRGPIFTLQINVRDAVFARLSSLSRQTLPALSFYK